MRHVAAAHDEQDGGMNFQRYIVSGYSLSIKVEWDPGAEPGVLTALAYAANTVMAQIHATQAKNTTKDTE